MIVSAHDVCPRIPRLAAQSVLLLFLTRSLRACSLSLRHQTDYPHSSPEPNLVLCVTEPSASAETQLPASFQRRQIGTNRDPGHSICRLTKSLTQPRC